MNCEFIYDGWFTKCVKCGRQYRGDKTNVLAECGWVTAGPGTRLKNFLENHGVTEEWYRNLKEKVGLVPECNCEMRRRYLDETWAAWQAGWWKSAKIAYERVKEYYAKPR